MTAASANSENENPIIPRFGWWWLGLALLLLLASLLYYRGYNASLPYIDHTDEPAFNLAAQTIIDSGSARSISFDAYPPGIITLNYLLINYVKPTDVHFAAVLPLLRLMTITVWMLAVVVVALIGAQLARPLTGLMAAAIWVANPWVVERVRFALPDAYVTFFTLLSLWLALVGLLHGRRYSTAAVYSLMLAIVFKTQAIFIAPLIWALPLVNLWRRTSRRGDVWRQTFWNSLRFAAFLFWLLLLYPTLEADRIPFWVAPTHRLTIPSLQVLWANLAPVLWTFQPLVGWLGIALCAVPLLRYRRRIQPIGILTVSLAALAWLLGISLFGLQHPRQFFALGALLALLYAVGMTSLLFLAEEGLAWLGGGTHFQSMLSAASLTLLLVIGLRPAFTASNQIAHEFSLPDRRNDLTGYMDASLEPAMYVSTIENHKTFNRSWGGYNGVHDFPRYPENALLADKPIETWRALGVEYAIMPHHLVSENPQDFYPDDTVQLKTYLRSSDYRGPDMVVLRLYPIEQPIDGQLGPIRLKGYDINQPAPAAVENIIFRLYWQAETATDTPYHVFNHLLNAEGEIVAQVDGIPLWDARRSTATWDDPDEILLGRNFTLALPEELAADTYTLVTGFYEPQAGRRLTASDGQEWITIAEIAVAAASR